MQWNKINENNELMKNAQMNKIDEMFDMLKHTMT